MTVLAVTPAPTIVCPTLIAPEATAVTFIVVAVIEAVNDARVGPTPVSCPVTVVGVNPPATSMLVSVCPASMINGVKPMPGIVSVTDIMPLATEPLKFDPFIGDVPAP
jgi:hypothetical protein